jgi:hypothetical protein
MPCAEWRGPVSRALAALAAVLALAQPLAAAEAPGVLTLLDGEATLLVGPRALVAAPGLRLPAGSIVETGEATGLLRIEWPDGSRLDLGPATRVMLRPAAAPRALVYVLRGIVKQTQDAAVAGQLSPAFELRPFEGVVVTEVTAEGAVLFAERGTEAVTGRRGGVALALQAGQAAVAQGEAPARAQPRPPAGWLARIPRAFRDTLPSRLSQFQGPPPAARARPQPRYADVQAWLAAEPGLRRELPARWAEWLSDPAFKAAVLARLDQHPEWEPLVRPPPRSAERPSDRNPDRPSPRRPAETPASAPESPR